jgi:uncharacterized protein
MTRKKLFLCLVLIFGPMALFLVIFWKLTDAIIYRPRFAAEESLAARHGTAFSVKNDAGMNIKAWWLPGKPGAGAVALCHGHGVDHTNMNDMIAFLRPRGFGLLLLDFRSHGESEGEFTSIGLHEWKDLGAVLEEAERRGFLPPDQPLAAYGRSMGAATLANGAADLPRIQAFILESSFADLRRIAANDARYLFRVPDCRLIDWSFELATWRAGYDYQANKPVERIADIGSRPVLLIHDEKDPRATQEAFAALHARVPHAMTLSVPGAGHVKAYATAPELFEKTVAAFLLAAGVKPAPEEGSP